MEVHPLLIAVKAIAAATGDGRRSVSVRAANDLRLDRWRRHEYALA
jgi:hypothetical protein